MHKIQCKCGTLRGHITGSGTCNRIVCYCADCRAFATYLDHSDEALDSQGGTEIVQLAQPRVDFSHGKENLAAVRLSDKGMVRWYAACCNTPIGNTFTSPKVPFIGLIHSSLDRSSLDEDFGKDIAILNVDSAIGEPKPKQKGLLGTIFRFFWLIVSMRVSGKYRDSQFFDESGQPVASPKVLTAEELKKLKDA